MTENNILFLTAIKEEIDYTFLDKYAKVDYLYTGIGKVNSAIALMKYLSQSKCNELVVINIGTCGSSIYNVGEIISVLGCCEYGSQFISQNLDLLDISTEVPFCKKKDYILSSDFFVTSQIIESNDFCDFKSKYHNFDMELAALAKVCKVYDLPLASFKVISDNLMSTVSEWEEVLKDLSPKLKEVVASILMNRKIIDNKSNKPC